jgi:hypothetical protein
MARKMFYLLQYAILDNKKLSQKTLEDTFNNSGFKAIFNFDESETVRRSSISERLSKIDLAYFKEIFEACMTVSLKVITRPKGHV